MTPEQIMNEWIKRLRSDNYYQIKGVLGTDSVHDGKVCRCAEGILADILTEAGFCTRVLSAVSGQYYYDGQPNLLFSTTLEKAGIQRHRMSLYSEATNWINVSEANDLGWTFERIAACLELSECVRA